MKPSEKLAVLLAAAALFPVPPAEGSVTVEVAAERLGAFDGSAAPTSTLVLLVADLDGTAFGRVPAGPLADFGYLDGAASGKLVVHRADLSNLGVAGALALSAPGLALERDRSGRWAPGTPLYLVWFPTLDASAASLPVGAAYGVVPLGETPRDGGVASFAYLTPGASSGQFGAGPVPAGAVAAPASRAVVDGSKNPAITVSPERLPLPFATTYGTPSAPVSFAVAGTDLSGPLTVSAPPGFEISTSPEGPYGPALVLPAPGGTVPASPVFARLSAAAAVSGNYDGAAFSLVGGGADPISVLSLPSGNAVAPKALALGGLVARNKVYDGTAAATVEGTPVFVGLVNGDDFPFAATLTWAFRSKDAGFDLPVSPLETIDPPSENYIVPLPELSARITTRNVTIEGGSVAARPYDGTREARILGATAAGVLAGDLVEVAGGGVFVTANAGSNLVVLANLSLVGRDAANYRIFQQPSLRGTILPLAQAIRLAETPPPLQPTNARVPLAALGGDSGQPVRYLVESGPGRIEDGVLSFTAPGEVVVAISQAGSRNYEAAEPLRLVFEARGASDPDIAVGASLAALAEAAKESGSARTTTLTSRRLRPVNGFVGFLNRGDLAEPLAGSVSGGNPSFRIQHFAPGGNVTASLLAGRYRTPAVEAGSAVSWLRSNIRPDRRRASRRSGGRVRILRRNLLLAYRASSVFDPSLVASGTVRAQTR